MGFPFKMVAKRTVADLNGAGQARYLVSKASNTITGDQNVNKSILYIALAASMAMPLMAQAATRDEGMWYLAPKIGNGYPDHERLSDNGLYLGFGVGYMFEDNWSIEGEVSLTKFDHNLGDGKPNEWRQLSATGAVRYLWDYNPGHPYLGIALGFGRNELRHANVDDWGVQIGAIGGFEWDFTDSGALRFEVGRKYTDFNGGGYDAGYWDTTVSLGYSVYFGGGGERYVQTESETVTTQSEPMESPPPVEAVLPERPLPVSITLNGVNFDFDKCTLRSDAIAILDEAVRVLNGNQIRVEVAGHTDAVGSDAYNQTLSECRAKVVADYLLAQGVANAEISAVNGYGESKPIDSNDTAEGRARNRRTELNVQ